MTNRNRPEPGCSEHWQFLAQLRVSSSACTLSSTRYLYRCSTGIGTRYLQCRHGTLTCMPHRSIYLYRCSTSTRYRYLQCRHVCPTVASTGTDAVLVPGTHSADMSDTLCMNSFASFCGGTGCSIALGSMLESVSCTVYSLDTGSKKNSDRLTNRGIPEGLR